MKARLNKIDLVIANSRGQSLSSLLVGVAISSVVWMLVIQMIVVFYGRTNQVLAEIDLDETVFNLRQTLRPRTLCTAALGGRSLAENTPLELITKDASGQATGSYKIGDTLGNIVITDISFTKKQVMAVDADVKNFLATLRITGRGTGTKKNDVYRDINLIVSSQDGSTIDSCYRSEWQQDDISYICTYYGGNYTSGTGAFGECNFTQPAKIELKDMASIRDVPPAEPVDITSAAYSAFLQKVCVAMGGAVEPTKNYCLFGFNSVNFSAVETQMEVNSNQRAKTYSDTYLTTNFLEALQAAQALVP